MRDLGYLSTKFLSVNCQVFLGGTVTPWQVNLPLCKLSVPHCLEKATKDLQELLFESWAGIHRYGKYQGDDKDIKSICQ